MGNCMKHGMLGASGTCRDCGHEYCDDCLLHPFGRDQAPMCIACALAFGGVTTTKVVRRRPERVSFMERRRRQQRPRVPEVSPQRDPDGAQPVDLPAWAR